MSNAQISGSGADRRRWPSQYLVPLMTAIGFALAGTALLLQSVTAVYIVMAVALYLAALVQVVVLVSRVVRRNSRE